MDFYGKEMPYFLRQLNLKENVAVDLNLYGNITKQLDTGKSSYFKKNFESTSISSKKLWKKLSPYIAPNKKAKL